MGDIFLTGTAKVTKMYIYIQLIKNMMYFPLTKGGMGESQQVI